MSLKYYAKKAFNASNKLGRSLMLGEGLYRAGKRVFKSPSSGRMFPRRKKLSFKPKGKSARRSKGKRGKGKRKRGDCDKPDVCFTKKVKAVIAKDEPTGLFIETDPYNALFPGKNGQFVGSFSFNATGQDWNEFSWARIGEAAAVLYKGKTPTILGSTTDTAVSGHFDADTKIKVISAHTNYSFTNQYENAVTVKLIECRAKGNDTQDDPRTDWDTALAKVTFIATATNNHAYTTVAYIGDHPHNYAYFNKIWKTTTFTKTLQPGQNWSHTLRLKPNTTYDFLQAKNVAADTKYLKVAAGKSVWVMVIIIPGPVSMMTSASATTAYSGYGVPVTSGSALGVNILINRSIKIAAPDETAIASKHQHVVSRNEWTDATLYAAQTFMGNQTLGGIHTTAQAIA